MTRRGPSVGSKPFGWIAAISGLAISLFACATPPQPATEGLATSPPAPVPLRCEDSIFQRASEQQSSYYEIEATRLQADLEEAEAAMIAIESGMKSHQSRADAVSALAEARISLENAARNAPWRGPKVIEAQKKLEEAEEQLQAGRMGTAIFFAARTQRIASALNDEARRVAADERARFIGARRVNLRAGPSTQHEILDVLTRQTPVSTERFEDHWWLVRTLSGQVGWVHAKLLQ